MLDFSAFASLKGEFEAEGLTRENVAAEVAFARQHSIDYLVKIGGCEAKSDINYLHQIGVTALVAPMIESPFAMQKYMDALPLGWFKHVGVTIETIDAVHRVEEILEAGVKLTDVTVGRSDLTASFSGQGVDSAETMEMVHRVAVAANRRGLEMTFGGGISVKTRLMLQNDPALAGQIAFVETRKAVIPMTHFLKPGVFEAAIEMELALLDLHSPLIERTLSQINLRKTAIKERL